MENLSIYEMGRHVPEEAKKPIAAGKLKGYSNINPMYRIKTLTEIFGPCGIGWWYEVTNQRLEPTPQGEIYAFVDIILFYKLNDIVSNPVVGVGGSAFLTQTRNGPQANDECFKMALTDAISVAAKSLGVAADVYWQEDRTKYGEWGAGVNMYAAQPQPVMPSNTYQQPVMAAPQPAPVSAPAPAPRPTYTQEQLEYIRSNYCDVGLKKGMTLGQVFDGPNAKADLGEIAVQTRNAYVKAAAEALLSLLG